MPAGALREFCEHMGGERWAANRLRDATLDSFPASALVMLSPDAKQPLEALDPAKVYCVGGLVDRTPRNGITIGVSIGQQRWRGM
jgi:tRNA (guanine9-N1)-methyltransferase